jgi:GT2 family glycosyltransferase
MNRLLIVSATREDPVAFRRHTKLGLSLQRLSFDTRVVAAVACRNAERLAAVYNRAIQQATDDDAFLFVHDDIYLDDYQLFSRVDEALRQFDVIGLAGNTRPDERHVGWAFWRTPGDRRFTWYDKSVLSGAVAHFSAGGEGVSYFGPFPQECQLLDGCFLAVSARRARERGVRFDERFAFHFYDLDFCRTCRQAGLRMGTWPIAVTHASGGRYGSPEWEEALKIYQEKWPSWDARPVSG